MTLLQLLQAGVPVVAFLLMMAVGLDVTRDDVRRLASRRGFVIGATAAQMVALPAAALLLSRALPPDASVRDYLLLTAACPGGGMSNVYVYLARANTALSVALTALSCLLAVVTMPVITGMYSVVLGTPVEFALPLGSLLAQLMVMAVIPVAAGALIRDRWPWLEERHGRTLRAISAAGVILIVFAGTLQAADQLDRTLLAGGLVAGGLVAAGMAMGWMFGVVTRSPREDRFTLLVEFAVRNLAIAMVIEVTLLGNPEFVAFGTLALLFQASFLLISARVYAASSG